MEFNKKINLLPQSYKNKYANKYLLLFFGGMATVLFLTLMTSLVSLALVNHSINRLTAEGKEYQSRQATILTLQESISKKQKLIEEYEKDNFPFHAFINTIATQKPNALTIISIDSSDRLIASNDALEAEETTEVLKENEKKESADIQTSAPIKQVTYEKDLAGEKLIVRGYSENSPAIASFISNLSRLFYVADAKLTAIEEHSVNGTGKANVFEVELQLK